MTAFGWVGIDASVWDLGDGPVALRPGLMGLMDPESEFFGRSTPALHGRRITGHRHLSRRVFWPLVIPGLSGLDWLTKRREFFDSLSYSTDGTFTVTAEDGSIRTIALHLGAQSDRGYDIDPALVPLERLNVELVADDPWWNGPLVLSEFAPVEDVLPFFATTSDRVFNLMSSSTVASATVSNPGDVEAWPKYTITGPVSEFSSTISGGVVSSVTNVIDGAVLVIDTDPTVQIATLTVGGVVTNVTRDLVGVDWRPVPAGGSVALDVTLIGTGSLVVSFLPRFYRAW
ncbi:hypothetical protein E3T43_01300 [Cryobacterium sp. Hh7]|uniref:hypothetical protein n=1 Tax=Cryobacterium sp. Hh7 TaxID=1259159 RepID=UPI001069F2CC|nr:hypothetical protein [Cryobacterium sp. Hh7]TFD61134.1 hypothetical protein E3T43_01300 [Cryobacterium sp. Hh7]